MPIRVQISHELGLAGDVIRGLIEAEDDIVIVDGDQAADVVISESDGAALPAALADAAQRRALAVSQRGHLGTLFVLHPERRFLGELSPAVLLAAIRSQTIPVAPAAGGQT